MHINCLPAERERDRKRQREAEPKGGEAFLGDTRIKRKKNQCKVILRAELNWIKRKRLQYIKVSKQGKYLKYINRGFIKSGSRIFAES